jgi:hypothetical protein
MKLDLVRDWLKGSGYDGALFSTQPEERRRSDEGRRHLAAPRRRASENRVTFVVGADGPVPVTNTANWPMVAGGRPAILCV